MNQSADTLAGFENQNQIKKTMNLKIYKILKGQ